MIFSYEPVCDINARLLILGTAPSPRSLESGFYYGHPQNRFWRLLSDLAKSPVPQSITEKKRLLIENGIALWDVLYSCEREGAMDADIRSPVPNDIAGLIARFGGIKTVFFNGSAAYNLYKRLHGSLPDRPCLRLPSTSPANARFDYPALKRAWSPVSDALDR